MVQLSSNQRRWYAVPSRPNYEPLDAKAKTSAEKNAAKRKAAAEAKNPSQTATDNEGGLPPLETLVEVLTEPGYELELRVWTATLLANSHPIDAAQMLGTTLASCDPKVLVAVIEGLTLDPKGKVKASLQPLAEHPESKVAKAAQKKLSGPN